MVRSGEPEGMKESKRVGREGYVTVTYKNTKRFESTFVAGL